MNHEEKVHALEERIGYRFHEPVLLKQALTHSSYANELKINKWQDYERLEFLGDAVLELVSSDFLFKAHPEKPEGQLTKLRSSMVCEPALAYCARDIDLGQFIFLGKGEDATGGRYRESITSDVMEAIIGAIYLDGGIEEAKRFIDRFILSDLEDKQLFYDSKTILQEQVQKKAQGQLHYVLLSESGPEHDKVFRAGAYIDDRLIGEGEGRTKKAAEQQAAYRALLSIKSE
ncbi:MAG: ribonuclease III [Lachnospiraceae bacterium]|nr:ribonuclease III [Lachnospiraceae bacterium]